MIATRHLVFLHLHKSGGTFVNQWLLRFFEGAQQIGYHLPRRLIPPELAGLPVIGLVRNPWSYYVSWYAFQSAMSQPNALFRTLSDDGALGFEGTITNMLNLGSGGAHLEAAVAALPPSYTSRGLNLPGPQLAAIGRTGIGFYTFLYRYMYGEDGAVHIARMESMRDELPPLVRAAGEPISAAAASHLAAAPPLNTTEHLPYADYYSAELRDLVAIRDGALIERHGYRFES
ncbi:MAG: hypothetical protein M3438_10510 [Pseudomonadota bacterium]|nr:hypothetical protein [Pseudomonadota bacterium]